MKIHSPLTVIGNIFLKVNPGRIGRCSVDNTEAPNEDDAAQAWLGESGERYKTIFETVPASIVVVDKNGQIIDINPYHVSHIGRGYTTKLDYLYQNIITHPSVVNAGLSATYQSVLEGKSFNAEGVYFPSLTGRTDGYFNVRAAPLIRHDRVVGAIMIHEDITVLKRTEMELRQAEELSRTLLETASEARQGIAVIQINDTGQPEYVYVNDEYAKILGYVTEELVGMDARNTVAPEMRDLQMDRYRRRQQGDDVPTRYEIEMIRKDGRTIPVEIGASTTIYQGQLANVAFMADISERKRQELERIRLQETLRSYASKVVETQEEERRRLARDLHDDTIQELLFVSHRIRDITSGTYGELPVEANARLEEVRAFIERTMGEVRSFTQEIRPLMLDDMGLVPTLRWLAERLSIGVDGAHVNVSVTGRQRRLSSDVELAMFRVAQESLNNVRRHSGASTASVTITFNDDNAKMTITDDGRGFDLPAIPTQFASQGKLGIAGMSERILLLDGSFDIDSKPGQGTTVKVQVPTT